MKLIVTKESYLTKEQVRKIFLALSIMTICLYIVAMIFSLCGSKYFILNYQNTQMDRIENFLRKYNAIAPVQEIFATLETTISLGFILNKIPKWYYIVPIYTIPLVIAYAIGFMPSLLQTGILIFMCFIIPIIDDILHKKFSWKSFGIHLLKLLIVSVVSFILQVIIYGIKSGDVSIINHTLSLSGYFVYSLEYDIALFVILFTISLYINREKGDSDLWTSQAHGGHWSVADTTAVAKQYGIVFIEFNEFDWNYVMNMIYSDYYGTVPNETSAYVKLAEKFIKDKDADPGKAFRYYVAMNYNELY